MTREEMRRQVVDACDYALNHPRMLGSEYVKIVKGLRKLAITDDDAVDKLAVIMQAQARAVPKG